ncbi:ABC-F family ATP-binding cassette domain-containing protein [Saccharopolyspora sp. 5N708]|uniref:ABC-F family ATP-binding cassette domain-containing protein n=1 Tax=Saccharopolyspora sp. 5N708 TaxID=3457424 RepID=UPI003FD47C04
MSDRSTVLARDRKAAYLAAVDVHCALGERLVLHGVSLTVAHGERVGLIGENGRGKSTLLRVLAGEVTPQRGAVVRAVTGSVGFLPQEPDFLPGTTVADVLTTAAADIHALADRMRDAEARMAEPDVDLDRLLVEYGVLQEEFTRRGGWEVDARTGRVLEVFGLAHVERNRPTGTLSGGERARLALASLVLAEPAGLLLDEPTNHLDERGVDWLVGWLADYPGPCLIASHDRVLLDAAVTAIVDLDGPAGATVRYGGGYRDYLAASAAADLRWRQRYRDWRFELAEAKRRLDGAERTGGHASEMTDRNKMSYGKRGDMAQAAVARAARAARLHLRRLLEDEVPRPPDPLAFTAPVLPAAEDGTLLTATGLAVGSLFAHIDLVLAPGTRHIVVGDNGAGKSTLLGVLAGLRQPEAGQVDRAPGIEIGFLPQESNFAAEGRPLLAAFTARRALHLEDATVELRRFGLFTDTDLRTPVNRLSIGQQRRLDVALLFAARPDVLLLDEPTNHLSLALVEQLQDALVEFPGPVVVATHDRTTRERFPHSLVELRA